MNINRVEIDIELYNAIMYMVNESVHKLYYQCNAPKEEIKILMPEWFLNFFRHKFNYISVRDGDFKYFFGIEVLPHYENEVVVFYKKYSVSNKRAYFKLSIDEYIKIQNYENTRHTGIPKYGCRSTENNHDGRKPEENNR